MFWKKGIFGWPWIDTIGFWGQNQNWKNLRHTYCFLSQFQKEFKFFFWRLMSSTVVVVFKFLNSLIFKKFLFLFPKCSKQPHKISDMILPVLILSNGDLSSLTYLSSFSVLPYTLLASSQAVKAFVWSRTVLWQLGMAKAAVDLKKSIAWLKMANSECSVI